MKIAFIIPVYNAEKTIRRAVASIDTKHDYEIICINDGSTDNSQTVLEQLAKEYKNIKIITQENKGAAVSRNKGLAHITSDAFMFLDADDQFLPSRIDYMADYYIKDEAVDIVVGQIGRGKNGEWQNIPTHKGLNKFEKVNLAQCPEVLQSIGPGAKMFNAKFADLRFDEDVVFCEEHTFITKAYKKASDIQLLPNIVYAYNEEAGSVTEQRTERFLAYMDDALKVRHRVMEELLLEHVRRYYSYRMDELIVSYLIQAYVMDHKLVSQSLIDSVTTYIKGMQNTDYEGSSLFRIVKVIEQGCSGWTKDLYNEWRSTLHYVGIGRPNYYRFKVEILPHKAKFRGKLKLKKILNR